MTNPHDHKLPIDLDLNDLLHPAQAFDHPCDVVGDADLTLGEKRAILASWASDACAVEAAPALRQVPGGRRIVSVDEILEALQSLDKKASAEAVPTSSGKAPDQAPRFRGVPKSAARGAR